MTTQIKTISVLFLILLIIAQSAYVNLLLIKKGSKNLNNSFLQSSQTEISGLNGSSNQRLYSKSGKYVLQMQEDGNLVLYSMAPLNGLKDHNSIWATYTLTSDKSLLPYQLVLQSDGNLVIYNKNGGPAWSSNTFNKGIGPYSLNMQDDGNLVLYDSKGTPTWSSETFGKI